MAIAPVLAQVAVDLDGLGEALAVPGSRLLDVGTGTGWLAIALARTFPSTEVTGIDIFAPSLALAARNVAAEHMSHRVTIQERDISTLDEPAEYDAIWLPLPFLPQAVVPKAIERALRALRPGGWVLPGTFAGPGDALSLLLNDLRIVRSGGHPWSGDQMLNMLSNAGFTDCQEKDRTWPAPVRVFAARRPI